MIVEIKKLNFNANFKELERRKYNNYILCTIDGLRGYIVGNEETISRLSNMIRFPISFEKEIKVPIYKQAMQLQMGRVPKMNEIEKVTSMAQVIKMKNPSVYNIWEIIKIR